MKAVDIDDVKDKQHDCQPITKTARPQAGDRSLNILQIISGREINGALVYCKLLTEQLVERGHRVTVMCRKDSWIAKQGLDVEIVSSNLTRFPPTELRKTAKLMKQREIDLVHTHMTRAHAFGTVLKMVSRDRPVIKSAHSRSVQLHWRFNDFVIANSQATADYHIRHNGIPQRKIQTVHCFIDTEKFQEASYLKRMRVRRQLKWANGEFLVGVVGEITKRKGQRYLIEALPRLVQEIPNLRVAMVGRFSDQEPYIKRMKRFLADNNIQHTTQMIGLRDNVEDFLTAMDVSVVPSLEEPLGLVAIESQAVGTPVVVADTGGLVEVVDHEMTGLIVPPRDADSIADAILRLAGDTNLRRRLTFRGKVQVDQRFSPDMLMQQVESVYEKAVHKKKKAA